MIDLEKIIDERVDLALKRLGVKLANDTSEHLSVAEYARRWSLSPSTVRAAIREKRLPITRVGRLVRIAADARISRASTRTHAEHADLVLLRGGKGR